MAELTFKSPGVSTKEIDLSGPTSISPTGVPAGIIGTANQGPAFVPVTIATFGDFQTIFGKTDGEKFGPLAMYEWMKNAQAGTYLRVLGAGNATKRLSSEGTDSAAEVIPAGGVKNAGFTAGQRPVKANGLVGANVYAHECTGFAKPSSSPGVAQLGRTYFLGAFMSGSTGSDYMVDAGLKVTPTAGSKASVDDAIDSNAAYAARATPGTFTITIPVAAGGTGTAVTIQVRASLSGGTPAANVVEVAAGGGATATLANIIALINGTLGSGLCAYGAGTYGGPGLGIKGIHAQKGSDTTKIKLISTVPGTAMNTAILADGGDSIAVALTMAGGTDGAGAQPILRGVLMAASGVLLALSGNFTPNASTASLAPAMGTFTKGQDAGATVGSITCGKANIGATANTEYTFTMLLNGHKNTSEYPSTLKASLNPARSNYISSVFNTDPNLLNKAGHLLYNTYDVTTAQAVITGSGIYLGLSGTMQGQEDVVFLMTSSVGRNVGDSGTTFIPNYESFADRFSHAFSPAIVSQQLGGTNHDLFTVHALDDGQFTNTNFKISIENIKKAKIGDAYGNFDLIVRKFKDSDEETAVVERGEEFRGLSLDPNSTDYIARRIGNMNTYFDFDKSKASQKIVREGEFANLSRYIRVSMASQVSDGTISKTALPVGFRGPYHLVTSGSRIMAPLYHPLSTSQGGFGSRGSILHSSSLWSRNMVEPPIPYRQNISDGTGNKKVPNTDYYWGVQTTLVDKASQPNSSKIFNGGINAYTKYYPKFATTRQAAWVGANAGAIPDQGTVYDSDKFNNNLFTLERIQIHTKSSGDLVDFQEWAFAKYRRTGVLAHRTKMTKADGTTDQGRFLNVEKDFGDLASQKYYKFTTIVQGGFDGVDSFNRDKQRMLDNACKREMDDELQGQDNGATVSAYMKALDIMSEKSDVDIQLLAVPGIRETQVTNEAVTQTEERFDALYIMDIEEKDVDNKIVTSSAQEISVAYTAETLRSRALDTSFAAAYFPDTIITDPNTRTNVRVPPSVSVIGAMSLNDSVAFPWFAPAGFTRGALTDVVNTVVNFNRANLDSLYETDINPITKFPSQSNFVVFGQKTLMATASSLDRVNVRRLLIDVRRKVRRIADTFIFEPNRASTLARFSDSVEPILAEIQAQQGVERYRVMIDTTTTTQADVENNTVRGKIFMQPTRAVEFIALDFVVTNNGTEI